MGVTFTPPDKNVNVAASNTTYTSGTVVLSGGNNITVGTNGQTITISGANTSAFSAGVSTVGNTLGDTKTVSNQVVLAGGNNITLSQSTGAGGATITISGPNVGGAQTGISGMANSETTYTSGSVTLSGLANITIRSTTGQHFQFSVSNQSNQTGTVYAASNTTGTSSGTYDARTLSIAGAGIISVAASDSGFRISATQSVQTQDVLSIGVSSGGNTAGNTTVNTGSRLVIVGSNGITASQGTAAGATTITLSGATQTNQSAIRGLGVSNTGNTAGNTGISTGIDWVLGGSGNITASQSTTAGGPNTVWMSVATQTVQTQSIITAIAASDTTYTSGSVQFTGSNMITVKSSANQRVVIDATQSVQTQDVLSIGVSTGGNTAGNTTVNTGSRLVIVGSNGITASQGTAAGATTITLSGITQSNQSAIKALGVSNTGNTSGNTGVSSGIDWVLAGSNNITASQSTAVGGPNTIWISGPTVGGAQTGISGIANSETTYTSGSVTLSALGAVTIRSTTGQHFQISVNSQTNQSAIQALGVSNTGNTAGNTGVSTGINWVVAGSNNITASQSTAGGGPNTIWISGPTTAAQTNQSGNVYAASNTTGTSSGTYDARTFSIAGDGIISVAASNSGFRISATQSVQTQSRFNLTLSGNSTSGGGGYIQISSGVMTLAGGNNITLSQDGNAVTVSAPNLGAGAMSAGVSNLGNTAGSTGITGTQLVLVGTNMISLSQSTGANGGTVSINATQSAQSAIEALGVSTLGNTLGNTRLATGLDIVLAGTGALTASQSSGAAADTIWLSVPQTSSLSATGAVSISTNGSTISIGAPTYGTISNWPIGVEQTTLSAVTAVGSLSSQGAGGGSTRTTVSVPLTPMVMPAYFSGNHLRMPVQISMTSASTNSHWTYSLGQSLGIYTLNGGSVLSLLSSFSNQISFNYSSAANSTNASATFRMSWGSGTNLSSSTSTSTNNAGNTSIWTSISNTKNLPFASGAFSMSPGMYWYVHAFTQSSGGANLASLSQIGMVADKTANLQEIGRAVGSTTGMWPLQGFATMTLTNSGLPSAYSTSDVTMSSNNGSWVQRAPALELLSRFY